MLTKISRLSAAMPFAVSGVLAAGLSAPAPVLAEYPEHPIVLVVAYAPGGGVDVVGRIIARYLSKELDQQVVIENKPGAGATIAISYVQHASPDGYTLLLADPAFAISTGLMPNVGYDIKTDFTPVSAVTMSPMVLCVAPALPVNTLAQLLALAKQRPGGLSYSSAGVGSTPHVAGELLKFQTHSNFTHIPFKGSNQAVTSLLAGQVDFSFSAIVAAKPFTQKKSIRPIATTGLERSPEYPDLPTVAETLPGFNGYFWTALYARAGTSPAIIRKLNAAMVKILANEEVRTTIAMSGDAVSDMPLDKTGEFVLSEASRWSRLIAEVGIKPE